MKAQIEYLIETFKRNTTLEKHEPVAVLLERPGIVSVTIELDSGQITKFTKVE